MLFHIDDEEEKKLFQYWCLFFSVDRRWLVLFRCVVVVISNLFLSLPILFLCIQIFFVRFCYKLARKITSYIHYDIHNKMQLQLQIEQECRKKTLFIYFFIHENIMIGILKCCSTEDCAFKFMCMHCCCFCVCANVFFFFLLFISKLQYCFCVNCIVFFDCLITRL